MLKYNILNGDINFTIDVRVYPVNVIIKTAYNFTPGYYVFFDFINENDICAFLKPKTPLSENELLKAVGIFYNELLNQLLRTNVHKDTKDLRQLILGRALYVECVESKENSVELWNGNSEPNSVPLIEDHSYEDDKYSIAKSWNKLMEFTGESNEE